MPQSSVVLKLRFGEAIQSPGESDMRGALDELFSEHRLGLEEGSLAEHPSTWLSYGFESGTKWTVVVVDVYRGGDVSFSRYDDQDDSDPAYEYWRRAMSAGECLRAWHLLAGGDEVALRAAFRPESGVA